MLTDTLAILLPAFQGLNGQLVHLVLQGDVHTSIFPDSRLFSSNALHRKQEFKVTTAPLSLGLQFLKENPELSSIICKIRFQWRGALPLKV